MWGFSQKKNLTQRKKKSWGYNGYEIARSDTEKQSQFNCFRVMKRN